MTKQDFWSQLGEGKASRVLVPETARRPATRTRIVRAAPWSHYAGYDERSGGRPRCRAQGCGKALRKDQPFACSPKCEALVRDEVQAMLRAITGKAA